MDALVGCAGLDLYTAAKGGVTSMVRSFGGVGRTACAGTIAPSFVSTEPQKVWLDDADASADQSARRSASTGPEQIAPFVVYPRATSPQPLLAPPSPSTPAIWRSRRRSMSWARCRPGISRLTMAEIELEHVTKAFAGGVVAVGRYQPLDRRRVYGLVGPSGCGKSTLLRMIGARGDHRRDDLDWGWTSPRCRHPSATLRWCSRTMRSIRT